MLTFNWCGEVWNEVVSDFYRKDDMKMFYRVKDHIKPQLPTYMTSTSILMMHDFFVQNAG